MASNGPRVLKLESIHTAGHQLSARYRFDEYRFSTSFWYDFDLHSLEETYGLTFMENVYFHCAAFDINKLCSMKPTVVDWGPYARWHTEEFERVWRTVVDKLGSQWRYENGLVHLPQPRFASEPAAASTPVEIQSNGSSCTTLALCSGGKDSLTVLEILSKANIPFATLTYYQSIYGQLAVQRRVNGKVVEFFASQSSGKRELCIINDFLDSPVLESLGKSLGIKTLIFAGETPNALFAALPILLHYRYTHIAIGNERSANVENLVWAGQEVNHQWEKTLEAELLLNGYIQTALIRNASFFSVLQPIHDVVIFNIAGTRPDAVVHTHSCNFVLPWCLRCPKCCYVWLSFNAYLPRDLVEKTFSSENLFDVAEIEVDFREMMGLGTKKPFECIGEIEEIKLAFELCRRKGLRGRMMEIYEEKVLPTMNPEALTTVIEKYTTVHPMESGHVPKKFRDCLQPLLEKHGDRTRKKLKALLLQSEQETH